MAKRPRRFLRLRYLVPLVILLLGGAGWMVFRPFGEAPAAAGTTHAVTRGNIEETLAVTGLVKPAVTIDLRSEASGMVESVSVKDGDRVTAGQELLRLDSRVATAALQEAEAALKQSEMQHAAAELDIDDETVALRKKALERQESLFQQGLSSQTDLEARQLELRQAERSLERAKRNLEMNLARIAQLRAAAERARTQLQHTIVRSPLDAWVIKRHVEVGSGVAGVSQSSSGGTVIITLGDARQASLQAKVTAGDAKKLRVKMPARLKLDSDPTRVVTGYVQSVATAGELDTSTRLTTFPVVIAVTVAADASWINVPAQAEIVVTVHENVVVIPERCLRAEAGGRPSVLVQQGDQRVTRSVEVGAVDRGQTHIKTGLEPGQTLVCR